LQYDSILFLKKRETYSWVQYGRYGVPWHPLVLVGCVDCIHSRGRLMTYNRHQRPVKATVAGPWNPSPFWHRHIDWKFIGHA